MSETLTKKHQPALVIAPQGFGLANDYGPTNNSPAKHKKLAMLVSYDKIVDLQIINNQSNNDKRKE
jgi:hypothetical protein